MSDLKFHPFPIYIKGDLHVINVMPQIFYQPWAALL